MFGLKNALHEIGRRSIFQIKKLGLTGKCAGEVLHGKSIVTGGDGRVGGEHTFAANFFNVLGTNGGASRFGRLGLKKFQREQRGVTFVHVITGESVVAQGSKHANATDAQNNFLTKTVVGIAAV